MGKIGKGSFKVFVTTLDRGAPFQVLVLVLVVDRQKAARCRKRLHPGPSSQFQTHVCDLERFRLGEDFLRWIVLC